MKYRDSVKKTLPELYLENKYLNKSKNNGCSDKFNECEIQNAKQKYTSFLNELYRGLPSYFG